MRKEKIQNMFESEVWNTRYTFPPTMILEKQKLNGKWSEGFNIKVLPKTEPIVLRNEEMSVESLLDFDADEIWL